MHKTHKKKGCVNILELQDSMRDFKQILVEISAELNIKNSYLITYKYWPFSKYALAIPIRNKESITLRNSMLKCLYMTIQR